MKYLALDKTTGDLIKGASGGVERVDEGRFVVQQVQSKLRTWLGGWILDQDIGWLSVADFEKNFSIADLERRATEIILGTQGVVSIDSMTSTYSKRTLTIQFQARTKYGVINLTIPWGVS